MTAVTSAPAATAAPGRLRAAFQQRWVRFALRRAGRLLVSLWVIVTAAFLIIHLIPGDPVRAAMGLTASPAVVEARREALGLNLPLWEQYLRFWQGLFTGDLGTSITNRLPVWDTIARRLPATLALALPAFAVALLLAIPIGVGMAVLTRHGRHRRAELAFVGASTVLGTIPDFVYGFMLVALFGVTLRWLPVAGRTSPAHYVLPVLALSIGSIAVLSRIVRVEVLGVLRTDYVRTARAKRLPAWRVYLRHALPNAVTATLTLGGMLLAGLVAGTVLVENVFNWPGLGTTIVTAITANDYPVAQGCLLVYGVIVLVVNTLVDLILALLDPRSTVSEG
ncbi:MAG: ABC transporter permease [Propionibacteriaceae bacterium]|nr:ABC transporter permease [Propionibacteriaceae bacterium]